MDMESLVLDLGLAGLGVGLWALADPRPGAVLRGPGNWSMRSLGILSISLAIVISIPESAFWSSLPGTFLILLGSLVALWRRRRARGEHSEWIETAA